jgi:glutamyl-tRNA reductase
MRISSASYAYPHLGSDSRAAIARLITTAAVPADTIVLSTCLRVEVVAATDPDGLDAIVRSLLGDDLHGSVAGRIRTGREAVTHVARVAAGLESPVLGEVEILTQFRQAVMAAQDDGRIGGLFARLLESLVSVGRKARDLMPGSAHASMGSIAAQVVGASPEVAVLGSGTMATAVVTGLHSLPAPPRITMLARRPETVTVAAAEVWPFERALEALARFPAVVSATSAKQRPVDDDRLTAVLDARTEPLILVDMAMPPDFVPPAGSVVRYVDIDDLARIADRRPRGAEADSFVSEAAAEAHRRYSEHHEVGPVISGLVSSADDVVERTVRRFAGRLESEDDLAVLQQAAHTVSRTLLAGPIEYLKRSDREGALETLAEAFGIADE